jgi:hypothetical protein
MQGSPTHPPAGIVEIVATHAKATGDSAQASGDVFREYTEHPSAKHGKKSNRRREMGILGAPRAMPAQHA